MFLFVGTRLGIYILIWFSYYLAMTILETISIIKYIKAKIADNDGKMILLDHENEKKNIEFESKYSNFRRIFEIK
ncbi:MAG: hypothetical protein IJ489_06120 [Clostridia bacterium]|nr:hypothetical protein [Clostridia bacterium]